MRNLFMTASVVAALLTASGAASSQPVEGEVNEVPRVPLESMPADEPPGDSPAVEQSPTEMLPMDSLPVGACPVPSVAETFAADGLFIPQYAPTYSPEADTYTPYAPPYPPGVRPPHTRKSFRVPRTRPWDWQNNKYLGGGPIVQGYGHGPNRHGVWDCNHYIVMQPPRRLTVEADALFLARDRLEPLLLVRRDDANGEGLFSIHEFSFNYQPGVRMTALWHAGHACSVEFSGFLVDESQPEAVVSDDDPMHFEDAGVTIPMADGPFVLSYQTSLASGELSLRRDLRAYHDTCSVFVGVRWINLVEEFRLREQNTADRLLVASDNQLLGLQIGVQSRAWVSIGLFRIDSTIKGGVYHNRVEQDASFGAAAANARGRNTAWVGEASISGIAPATSHCFIRGGYQLIHLAGVALPSDQLATTDLAIPATAIDDTGSVFFHGFHLGIEGRW